MITHHPHTAAAACPFLMLPTIAQPIVSRISAQIVNTSMAEPSAITVLGKSCGR